MRRSGRPKASAPEPSAPWRVLLLDTATTAAVAQSAETLAPPGLEASSPRAKPARRSRKRAFKRVIRVSTVVLTVVTVAGLAFGAVDLLSGTPDRTMAIRLGLLLLVAAGLWRQVRGLLKLLPLPLPHRKRGEPPPVAPFVAMLLDQAQVAAIGELVASLPPIEWRGPRRTARWASAGSWFVLAFGVIAVLAAAVIGVLVNLLRLALADRLTLLAAGFGFGMAALLSFGLWMMVRTFVRSIGETRLRKRKRALRQLLRALLNWLLRGRRTMRMAGVNAAAQFAGLCLLAGVAIGAGVVPALSEGGAAHLPMRMATPIQLAPQRRLALRPGHQRRDPARQCSPRLSLLV